MGREGGKLNGKTELKEGRRLKEGESRDGGRESERYKTRDMIR